VHIYIHIYTLSLSLSLTHTHTHIHTHTQGCHDAPPHLRSSSPTRPITFLRWFIAATAALDPATPPSPTRSLRINSSPPSWYSVFFIFLLLLFFFFFFMYTFVCSRVFYHFFTRSRVPELTQAHTG
jgi:hypothetical protein